MDLDLRNLKDFVNLYPSVFFGFCPVLCVPPLVSIFSFFSNTLIGSAVIEHTRQFEGMYLFRIWDSDSGIPEALEAFCHRKIVTVHDEQRYKMLKGSDGVHVHVNTPDSFTISFNQSSQRFLAGTKFPDYVRHRKFRLFCSK